MRAALVPLAALLIGCAAKAPPTAAGAERPVVSVDTVRIGMEEGEVLLRFGRPDDRGASEPEGHREERWYYGAVVVTFVDGRVTLVAATESGKNAYPDP